MKRSLIIFLLQVCSFAAFSKYQQYIVVSFAGCANCSNALRIFAKDSRVFEKTILLSDPSAVTKAQLVNIAIENFGVHFNAYKLDQTLYQKFTNGEIPKLPYFIITDGNEIVVKIRIDSLMDNIGILNFFEKLPGKAITKVHNNTRLKQIGGYADLSINGNMALVKYYNKSDRAYLYNLSNGNIDSLYFSKNKALLQLLLIKAGDTATNPASTLELFEQYNLPFNLYQLGRGNATKDGFIFSNNLLYVNVDEIDTMISPKWLQYLVDFNIENQKTTFLALKNWHDTLLRPRAFLNYYLDDYLYQKLDSVHWMASARLKDSQSKGQSEIAFITFELQANGLVPIKATTFPAMFLKDFKNTPLLKENYIIQLNFEQGFLFFNESPHYNLNGKWRSFSDFNLPLTWILDAKLIPETEIIRLVASNAQKQTYLYYLDASTQKVLHQIKLNIGDYKSNAVLTQDKFYYLNKEGIINQIVFK